MAYRLGVDVGGTFTDLLMIENDTGKTYRSKVPSTPHDPEPAYIAKPFSPQSLIERINSALPKQPALT